MAARIPDKEWLEMALRAGLEPEWRSDTLTVCSRQANPLQSTFTSEIVTLNFEFGVSLEVFCKYDDLPPHNDKGNESTSRGVVYEACVYRNVLKPLSISVPKYYGAYSDDRIRFNALFIEHLSDGRKISMEHETMLYAARWLGQFHAVNEKRRDLRHFAMPKYNSDYYCCYSRRAANLAGPLPENASDWLPEVCAKFETVAVPLLLKRQTIIHGDFYPANVLVSEGLIKPLDWGSALVAAGEIDLAFLMQAWSEDVAHDLKMQYLQTRYPAGTPAIFDKTLAAAKLFSHFRWWEDRTQWDKSHEEWNELWQWRLHEVRAAAQVLRII